MKILLSPHPDDEILFASYAIMREKPLVVIVTHPNLQGDNGEERLLESYRAVTSLGANICFLGIPEHEMIADARFNRFDQELIDTYFNDEGKEAIRQYVTQSNKDLLERVMSELDDIERRNARKTSRPQISKETETRGEYYSRTQGFKSAILVARSALQKIEEEL